MVYREGGTGLQEAHKPRISRLVSPTQRRFRTPASTIFEAAFCSAADKKYWRDLSVTTHVSVTSPGLAAPQLRRPKHDSSAIITLLLRIAGARTDSTWSLSFPIVVSVLLIILPLLGESVRACHWMSRFGTPLVVTVRTERCGSKECPVTVLPF